LFKPIGKMSRSAHGEAKPGMRIFIKFACAVFVLAVCALLGLSLTASRIPSPVSAQTAPVGTFGAPSALVSARPQSTAVQGLPAQALGTSVAGPDSAVLQGGFQPATTETLRASPHPASAVVPQVTFRDGLLSIRAENATLDDVLHAVQGATGASVDLSGSASERVNVHLGPAESRDVLTSLLDGSQYDYVLLASPKQKNFIERIVLIRRRDAGVTLSTSTVSPNDQDPQVAERIETTSQPMFDTKQLIKQQELQFGRQFGACIIQGCDAS
jgi:hypothetical protein